MEINVEGKNKRRRLKAWIDELIKNENSWS